MCAAIAHPDSPARLQTRSHAMATAVRAIALLPFAYRFAYVRRHDIFSKPPLLAWPCPAGFL